MDQITHQVRLANWKKIIKQCSARPQGTTVKQWLTDHGISDKSYYYWLRRVRLDAYSQMNTAVSAVFTPSEQLAVTFAEIPVPDQLDPANGPFQADAVIHTGSLVIGISNSVSESLLAKLLEAAGHAR